MAIRDNPNFANKMMFLTQFATVSADVRMQSIE